jgi:RNA-binding protein
MPFIPLIDSPATSRQSAHLMALEKLPNSILRDLKARAQKLEPLVKVGKSGLTEGFYRNLDEIFANHELVKVKFADLKDQKKELTPQIVEKSQSHLILQVGNVIVLYRKKPDAAVTEKDEAAD